MPQEGHGRLWPEDMLTLSEARKLLATGGDPDQRTARSAELFIEAGQAERWQMWQAAAMAVFAAMALAPVVTSKVAACIFAIAYFTQVYRVRDKALRVLWDAQEHVPTPTKARALALATSMAMTVYAAACFSGLYVLTFTGTGPVVAQAVAIACLAFTVRATYRKSLAISRAKKALVMAQSTPWWGSYQASRYQHRLAVAEVLGQPGPSLPARA